MTAQVDFVKEDLAQRIASVKLTSLIGKQSFPLNNCLERSAPDRRGS